MSSQLFKCCKTTRCESRVLCKGYWQKDPGGIPPEAERWHHDHASLRLLERQKYGADQDRRRGGSHGAARLFSVLAGARAERDRPAAFNAAGRKTPAQLRAERCGREVRHTHKTRDGQFLWTYASVKNILVEEAYTGVLNNHRREYNNGKAKHIDKADWCRHEGFFPVIIEKQEWEQVQRLLKQQARPANGNQAKHRYAGLLTCRECGNTFIPMIRCWNGKSRVEYVCRGYHRNGKTYCASHRIHEEVLDEQVWALVSAVRDSRAEELKKLAQLQKMWALRKPVLDAHILSLQEKVLELEQEIDEIVMEHIHTLSKIDLETNGV